MSAGERPSPAAWAMAAGACRTRADQSPVNPASSVGRRRGRTRTVTGQRRVRTWRDGQRLLVGAGIKPGPPHFNQTEGQVSKWTDEEAEAAYWKCAEDWSPQSEWSIRPTIGRALLDAREQVAALRAEVERVKHECDDGSCPSATHERMAAAQSVPIADMKRLQQQVDALKAEVKAWRSAHSAASPAAFTEEAFRVGHCEDAYELMHRSIGDVVGVCRAATDALFKEGL